MLYHRNTLPEVECCFNSIN